MISALALYLVLAQHQDLTYESKVFAGPRNYRLFLPADYVTSKKQYGVIYYFHGHSDRYTLEHYDQGKDTVPKIEDFVAKNDVIVVAPDGFVAKHYTGFYGGTPYDVREEGGDYDFGLAFQELVAHVDKRFRTHAERRYRAISGLSMGGFMSLWLSARYPELIGSASAFNPGPEFYLGEKGRRSLWRPKDHAKLHESTPVRLIRASGDYISQYHEETRAVYARTPEVDFEFRQDEYHRHWATSIAETFAFHLNSFNNPKPLASRWSFTSPYQKFQVRGFNVEARNLNTPALISLEDVTAASFRVRVRRWAPDGPSASCEGITIQTGTSYQPGKSYSITQHRLDNGEASESSASADGQGRLALSIPCTGRQITIGSDSHAVVLTGNTHFVAGEPQQLKLRILNAKTPAALSSDYPTVQIEQPSQAVTNQLVSFPVRFNASSLEWAHARLKLKVNGEVHNIDVEIAPDGLGAPVEMKVLDGRTETFSVFRQKGNQGGGSSIQRTVTEGTGNGDGILQPGERATIWLKYKAGIDGLDRGNWCRAKVYADSPWLSEAADIQEQKQLEWTSAMNRTSLIEIAKEAPQGAAIPMILDCESWTYYFTPDLRYGREALYQAFQFHRHHLFRTQWNGSSTAF